jgi:uncharacterized Rossmann fold enzyme
MGPSGKVAASTIQEEGTTILVYAHGGTIKATSKAMTHFEFIAGS